MENILINTRTNIEKFGLEVIMVMADDYLPGFAYSVGLTQTYDHPEIICFGLPSDLAHAIINDVAEMIRQGKKMEPLVECGEIFKDSRAVFLKVDQQNLADYVNVALVYYDTQELDVLQLVWTDRNDKFPWEDGFEEEFRYDQSLLDRNADFRFYEPKNLSVFTTRQWIEKNAPIVRVVHDYEGDWQFLTGDQEPEDIRIVALEELIKRDPTLNEVFDLGYGKSADRNTIGEEWTREQIEEEDE